MTFICKVPYNGRKPYMSNRRKDFFWNTIGVFAQNAISPLLLIVITRVNGIYDSGLFSFAFSVSIVLWVLGMWGGRTFQVSDVKQEFSHQSYLLARMILAVTMLFAAIAFSVINQYDAVKTAIIVALVLFKAVESVADAMHGVMQVHEKLYVVGRLLLVKAAGGFAVFTVIDVVTKDLLMATAGIVIVNILITLLYDLRFTRRFVHIRSIFSGLTGYTNQAITMLRDTSPVFAVVFLSMFSLNIPRYFVDKYHEDQIGYFGILAMPVTLIVLLMTFILQPNVLILARYFSKSMTHEFNKLVKRILGTTTLIGIGVFAVTILIGIPFLELIFGVSFSGYESALWIVVVGGIINAIVSIFINILIITRHFKFQFFTLLVTNIVLAIVSAMVIEKHGLLSGVMLYTAANVVQAILLVLAYKTSLRSTTIVR